MQTKNMCTNTPAGFSFLFAGFFCVKSIWRNTRSKMHRILVSVFATLLLLAGDFYHASSMMLHAHDESFGGSLSPPRRRTFSVDFSSDCRCFRKDGAPFRYIAGVMHYYKVPRQYWPDRLAKMKAAGITVLQTYIAWNLHEPFPGQYDFDDMHDIIGYIELAMQNGFYVIARPGPFVNNELDLGGLPFWLMHYNATVQLRTRDPCYTRHVRRWLDILLPKLRPLLYINGGNILSIQIENEYGYHDRAVPCDKTYLKWLYGEFRRHLGDNVAYFTVDAPNARAIDCGHIDENVLVTLDFGSAFDPATTFDKLLRPVQPNGPAVNTEFHTGFGQRWGGPAQSTPSEELTKRLRETMEYENYSCASIYMFEGGTNFGFLAGSYPTNTLAVQQDGNNNFQTIEGITTSFEFNGPLTENGDTTNGYFQLRDIILQYTPPSPSSLPPVPANITRVSYGKIAMKRVATLFDNFERIAPSHKRSTKYPPTFEEMLLNYGFALYQHEFTTSDEVVGGGNNVLSSPGVRDRAIVFVDNTRVGLLSRIAGEDNYNLNLANLTVGQRLSVLVENQGRIAFLVSSDRRGLAVDQPITLNSKQLLNWTTTPIPLNDSALLTATNKAFSTDKIHDDVKKFVGFVPTRYDGYFNSTTTEEEPTISDDGQERRRLDPADTFFRMDTGWGKGLAFVNGRNLGRYWPLKGRQMTLYVPGVWLKANDVNHVVLFEVEQSSCDDRSAKSTDNGDLCYLKSVDSACLNYPKC